MIELTKDNFEEETKTGKIVVDCWAKWCGKCKMLKPKFEELAQKNTDYKFCTLDVDAFPVAIEKLNIANLPTILVFEDGKEVKRGSFDIIKEINKEI